MLVLEKRNAAAIASCAAAAVLGGFVAFGCAAEARPAVASFARAGAWDITLLPDSVTHESGNVLFEVIDSDGVTWSCRCTSESRMNPEDAICSRSEREGSRTAGSARASASEI